MTIKVNISLGELVDKISILKVKNNNILDRKKLKNIKKECIILEDILNELKLDGIDIFLKMLTDINNKLWDVEDNIRIKERDKEFDDKYIQLARNVYTLNDERFKIKSKLNRHYNSEIVEEKEYEDYEG